jgi:hypothetical protein
MCGGAAFTAAREDFKEQKKHDENGLVMSSYKPCIVPYAINTHVAIVYHIDVPKKSHYDIKSRI